LIRDFLAFEEDALQQGGGWFVVGVLRDEFAGEGAGEKRGR